MYFRSGALLRVGKKQDLIALCPESFCVAWMDASQSEYLQLGLLLRLQQLPLLLKPLLWCILDKSLGESICSVIYCNDPLVSQSQILETFHLHHAFAVVDLELFLQ